MFKKLILSIVITLTACNAQIKEPDMLQEDVKMNGISFVATRTAIDKTDVNQLNDYNANHVAVIPYGFMRDLNTPQVMYNTDRQWWGERKEGVKETITLFKKQGIHVMLKPQIWIWRGEYTGGIALENETQWKELENSYRTFIMDWAQLASDTNTPMLCIATELDSFVKLRPDYWRALIKDIRAIYKGKLTYAGNWDSYKHVTFWDVLDYIGVDAYFPVSDEQTPTLETVKKNWTPWKVEMAALSKKHSKKILFTEYGYITADYAGKEPWKSAQEHHEMNEQGQQVLFQGLYESVWQEDWMAGGFLWKHFADQFGTDGMDKLFTVKGKLAQKTVAEAYNRDTTVKQ